MKKFKFIDLFAGIGGFHTAMHEIGGECVFASEIDDNARKTYKYIFEQISPQLFNKGNFNKDITDKDLDYNKIPDFDILCAGFPCQAFSVAGYRQGFNDEKGRGNLFFNIVDILRIKKPKLFILENVKNLKGHDGGRTYQKICHELTKLGYGINSEVLNSADFGLPQNRERIFIIGMKNGWSQSPVPEPTKDKVLSTKELDALLLDDSKNSLSHFVFPVHKNLIRFNDGNDGKIIKKVTIDNNSVQFCNPPYHLQKYLEKFEDRTDWEKYIYNFKDGHFKKVVDYINSKINNNLNVHQFENWDEKIWDDRYYDYVYQWRRKYVRKNASSLCPTLTANMGTGGHNVPLVICGKVKNELLIRKLTPKECFALQGFSSEKYSSLESLMSPIHLYKQSGNSISVNVVHELASKVITLL